MSRHLSVYPSLGSTIAVHSAVPLRGRAIVVINSEALHERSAEPADYVATVDISDESDPTIMAVFPPPRPPKATARAASSRRVVGSAPRSTT
jgi:hypothetical protein